MVFCNDFVGKNRFQWSDVEIALINGIRLALLEEIYEVNGKKINRFITRPNINKIVESEPSEVAHSESIIQAVCDIFDKPLIINTRGVIYHACLNNILQNIPERSELRECLLNIDDEIAEHGYTH